MHADALGRWSSSSYWPVTGTRGSAPKLRYTNAWLFACVRLEAIFKLDYFAVNVRN